MKAGWHLVPMGKLCAISSGESDTKDAVPDGPYAFFDRSKTIKRSSRFLYDCEALIIPGEGKEFLPKYYKGKFDLHQRAYALFEFRPELDVRFLFHLLHHRADYFPSVAVGATVKSLRRRHFDNLPVPLPPLPEQHRIVAILDEAFEGLAIAKANAEKNLQNARALFESHLQSVFTERGEGWVEKRIEEWCSSIMDCVNKTAPVVERPTPFKMIRTTNVRNGYVDVSRVRYVTEETYRIWTRRQIPQKGDVILTREAPMGEVGMLLTDDQVFLGQRLVSYRANVDVLDNQFLLLALQSEDLQGQIHAKASGSTVQHMRVPDTKNLLLAAPSLQQQRGIVYKLGRIRAETQRLESLYQQKLTALYDLKKSLLHQAFSGQL